MLETITIFILYIDIKSVETQATQPIPNSKFSLNYGPKYQTWAN